MKEYIQNSVYFGAVISLLAYWIGTLLKKNFTLAIFNPLLISVVLTIVVLCLSEIEY